MSRFELVESPRPETKEAEDAYFLGAYRKALEDISYLLRLPGCPCLISDTVEGVRKLIAENDRLKGTK